ncbi:hypothetical protein AALA79_15130 [Lachnospiraceae bacterium 64-25]
MGGGLLKGRAADGRKFEIWCNCHYSVCREQSILGASNHVIIIGEK